MAKNIDKDLEKAILEMPQKEKDKILLRLIDKNVILVEQLHYRLLEDEDYDLQVRKDKAIEAIVYFSKLGNVKYPKFILKHLRSANGSITHFKKITANKIGEIELYLILLNSFFENHSFITNYPLYHPDVNLIRLYLCNKLSALLKLIDKVHEDYKIEFAPALNKLLAQMQIGEFRSYAKEFKFPEDFSL